MAGFVKLHCSMLRSTTWLDKPARDVFITALLMAVPFEVRQPTPQIAVDSLECTGWEVPPGWYGFCETSGPGLIDVAKLDDGVDGYEVLRRLGQPEPASRSQAFEGRRLVRVDGGYIVLNYDKYREKDTTAAERAQRYRSRKAQSASRDVTRDVTCHAVTVTQAEAEAEAEAEMGMATRAHERSRVESTHRHRPSSPAQSDAESAQGASGTSTATSPATDTQTRATGPSTPQQSASGGNPASPGTDNDRETICPTNLVLPTECVADIANKLGVETADVLAVQQEFVAYWTFGGGAGKRRRNWVARLRQEVLEKHKRGQLLGLGAADSVQPIARGKRDNVSANQAIIVRVAARMKREREANDTRTG